MKYENKKTCGECKHFVADEGHGGCCTFICDAMCDDDRACYKFQKPTNGDIIRQMSNEELAELLTNPPCFICSKGDAGGECTDTWVKKNCKEAIIVRLNAPAVCVSQNGKNDTQTDLCTADNTESEGKDEC